jgi:hypothetical protein
MRSVVDRDWSARLAVPDAEDAERVGVDAGVVTEDRGIVSWADEFGLRYVRGSQFPTLLEEYLRATGVEGYDG